MSFAAEEIARQPQAWRVAAEVAASARAVLPQPGARVAFVGCGTSWFMAECAARLRESAGLGESDYAAASEFDHGRRYDLIVAITRSGTTTEVLDLLSRQRGRTATLAITADPDTPVDGVADEIVAMPFADERSVVQTLFATTALALLRAHLGHDVAALADECEAALAGKIPTAWLDAEQFTFLGTGWAHGIAREAALKMREAAQVWTEAYPTREYRHGPVSIAAPGRVVWQFGPGDGLAAEVAATGAEFDDSGTDAMVDLVRVQRLAVARAERAGLDPDRPRNLTRSVVLPGAPSAT